MTTQTTSSTDNREAIIAMCLSRIERAMMREITLELLRGSGRNVDKITDESLDAMAVATANLYAEQVAKLDTCDKQIANWLAVGNPLAEQLLRRVAVQGARLLKRQVMGE